jgi:pyruvate dehydrogenase E2 component (dihydrolipoamide acetyltransferase)
MATDIVMPQMGESIVEGTITKWLKKPGDKIQRDEPLFEISTDKVDAEIPAPASGVLQEIKVTEGTTVQVNTVVGTISADGEGATASKAPEKKAAPAVPNATAPAKPQPHASSPQPDGSTSAAAPAPPAGARRDEDEHAP